VVLARPIVVVLYGARWAPSAKILAILAVFGASRVVIALFSDLLVAMDRTRRLFQLQLLWLGVLTPAMVAGVYLEKSSGAAMVQVLVAIGVVIPAYLVVLARSVGISLRSLIRPVGRPLLASVVGGAVTWFVISTASAPWLKLGLGIGYFCAIYPLLLGWWLVDVKDELVHLYGRDHDPAGVAGAPELDGLDDLQAAGRHRRKPGSESVAGHAPVTFPASEEWAGAKIGAGFTRGSADLLRRSYIDRLGVGAPAFSYFER
jgi:hypothetical protein